MPLCSSELVAEFADVVLPPATLSKDTKGIWAETTLDMSDPYQEAVVDLVKLGALSWSSGSAAHVVQKNADGRITRWFVCENEPHSESMRTATPSASIALSL